MCELSITCICCSMFFSWTRNSFASLALSETPFRAWESWHCREKEWRCGMITLFCVWHYTIELRAEDAWHIVNEVLLYLQACTHINSQTYAYVYVHKHILYTQSHTHKYAHTQIGFTTQVDYMCRFYFYLDKLSRAQQNENLFRMTPSFRQDQAHNQMGALAPGSMIQYQEEQPFAYSPLWLAC